MKRASILLASIALSAAGAYGHGGGLDAAGCHTNHKTGDYHCHRSPVPAVPEQPTRQPAQQPTGQPALPARPGAEPAPALQPAPLGYPTTPQSQSYMTPTPAVAPTCFVGPRGGTYTITKSGKKNYGGC